MPKAYFYIDELYPFYELVKPDASYVDGKAEVSEEQLADWIKVMDDFWRVQGEMRKADTGEE